MNILVLEDRGSVSFYMEEALRNEGHTKFSANNVNDAQSFWEKEDIDCIIVDLNMPPNGLEADQINQTKHGVLTGWIWLKEYIYKNNEDMKQRTIIYTDYMKELREKASSKDLEGIYKVAKRGSESPAKQLLNYVKEIASMLEKSS